MAVNSITYNFDEILSTTLMNWRTKGEMYDNIFKSNPTLWWFHEKGRKKTENGGERICVPLQYGENTTIGTYSRYGIIDTTPQDNQTSVYYNWKQMGGSITIDGLSTFQNSGKHQIVKLLEAKIKETEDTMAEKINAQLWKASPGTNDILSLTALIVRAPTTTDAASPGGISGATHSWWANRTKTSAATTVKGLVWEARNLYNQCMKGGNGAKGGYPDLAICNQETYEAIENHMTDLTRYVDSDLGSKARSNGFENIKFKNCTLFWDEHVPDAYGNATTAYDWDNASVTYGSLYFINTQYTWYVVGEGHDLKVGKFIEPENQDASTAKVLHYHQLVCSQRRKNGVLEKISKSLTS